MNSGIYIISMPNGRVYIGSSNRLTKRKNEHYSQLMNNKHHCIALQKAFDKYKVFNYIIIEKCSVDKLIEREQFWIDHSHLVWNKRILNGSKIAGRPDYCDETRKKMSISAKNKPPMTQETKEKLSKIFKGRKLKPFTEEHKAKIRAARARQVMKPLSEEHKERIRQSNRARKGVRVTCPISLANLKEGAKKRANASKAHETE